MPIFAKQKKFWILEPLVSKAWPFSLRHHTLIDQLLHHRFHGLVLFRGRGEVGLHVHSSKKHTHKYTHTSMYADRNTWIKTLNQHNHAYACSSSSNTRHCWSSSGSETSTLVHPITLEHVTIWTNMVGRKMLFSWTHPNPESCNSLRPLRVTKGEHVFWGVDRPQLPFLNKFNGKWQQCETCLYISDVTAKVAY